MSSSTADEVASVITTICTPASGSHPHRSAYRKLEITSVDYTRLASSKEAIATIRPGALGFEWVARIEPSWSGPE